NIPYSRNPFFTGREDTLEHLHAAFMTDNTVVLADLQGITGLGGVGKTQTALEYAYRYGSEYHAVFWARADSRQLLLSSLVEIAQRLSLPESNDQDQFLIVDAVLRWFRSHTGWLLIFDNVDDLSTAEPYIPSQGSGHILLTTRAHALGGFAQSVRVSKMEPDTGALLLLRKAGLLPTQATLEQAQTADWGLAWAISLELDGLPLALDQAGAYIKETKCPLSEFLPQYQLRHREILDARRDLSGVS
ncbi:MAG TPA: NB-ARC domain-containing protein, partial [Ktedonobacteraceae bacterium]|nr:NB-ARC domain-containing protein [Ktedonobacteraceae bacterium]